MKIKSIAFLTIFVLIIQTVPTPALASGGGEWKLLQHSIGISAMHMQLLYNDRIIIFDRTDFGASNISLPDGKCRRDPNDWTLKIDCTAHSVEYDVTDNVVRPLTVLTDTWCSSGTVNSDGQLIQTGGSNDGELAVRLFEPCNGDQCDWQEIPSSLIVPRWYATNQILPDGQTSIVIGGRGQFNYEFIPKDQNSKLIEFPFLKQTKDPEENNLYPFVHLNVDGHLFIFSNNVAILLNHNTNTVVRTYPSMPDGHPRNYPSTGSSVLLPLNPSGTEVVVLICGGAPKGAFGKAFSQKQFVGALNTCGSISINDPSPTWTMTTMPVARVMSDMILLPSGDEVLIINGAGAGTAGWDLGRDPVLTPVIYTISTQSFKLQNQGTIARMYHSTAMLVRDGRVLVGGSNPHAFYNFTGVEYPTELSLESFSPDYLSSENSGRRPTIAMSRGPFALNYGKKFGLPFTVGSVQDITVTLVAPSFTTHSFGMNQRLLMLESEHVQLDDDESSTYEVVVTAPSTAFMAPPGFYMLFVVNGGIPSEGIWVHVE